MLLEGKKYIKIESPFFTSCMLCDLNIYCNKFQEVEDFPCVVASKNTVTGCSCITFKEEEENAS